MFIVILWLRYHSIHNNCVWKLYLYFISHTGHGFTNQKIRQKKKLFVYARVCWAGEGSERTHTYRQIKIQRTMYHVLSKLSFLRIRVGFIILATLFGYKWETTWMQIFPIRVLQFRGHLNACHHQSCPLKASQEILSPKCPLTSFTSVIVTKVFLKWGH